MSQKFKSDIELQAGLRDSSGALGTSGQILSSTGSNVSWINQSTAANDVQNQVKAGVAINKGQAVYVTGADGTNIIVGLASNASEATSSKTLGLLNATVAINGMADVVQIGRLSGLNTLGATAGDPVWLGTGGNLIYGLIGKPYAPANLVFIGIVTRVNVSNGEIFVNVQNGFELNEIHDVDLKTTVPINGDVLGFNGTLWVNKTIAGWLGYTPANASGTTNYVSKFTGTTTLGNSLLFDNGTNVGIGTTSPGSKLDVSSGNINLSNSFNLTSRNNANTFNIALIGRSSTDRVIIDADGYGTNIGGGGTVLINPSGGNVGIGTTNPGSLLQVGQISSNTDSLIRLSVGYSTDRSSRGGITWNDSTNVTGKIYTEYDGTRVSMVFGSLYNSGYNSNQLMVIRGNGNVGIGTTSPGGRLQVSSATAGDDQIWLQSTTYTGGYSTLGYNANTGEFRIKQNDGGSAGITFYTGASASEKMRITPSGNVGIGTTSPAEILHLQSSQPVIRYTKTGVLNWKVGVISGNNFTINTDSGGGDAFNITTIGNVGIGTSSPFSNAKLQIRPSSDVNIAFQPSNGLSSGGKINAFDDAASVNVNLELNGLNLGFKTNETERMRITSSGNVGIGTTSPGAKLDVNGDALINGLTIGRGGGNISTNTVIGNGALASTSSGGYNIAIGYIANSNSNVSGLTAIGAGLQYDTNLNNLEGDCLAISQTNGNADASQVPHIYAPKPISIGGGATNIITFDLLHYAGAIVEYMIRLDDGGDYAVGTVYMGWKSSGSGNMIDKRQIEWSNMSGFVFSLGGSGQTLVLTNTSGNNAWIRITVRGMMTN